MLRSLFRRLWKRSPARLGWQAANAARIERLRRRGVTIGARCVIFTDEFSLEPYLVEIGADVAVSGGTMFLTHDGAAWLLRRTRPDAQHFGRIRVGDGTYIGLPEPEREQRIRGHFADA
jgi:acetyltransferase-like isoleucine patch superfamily enzyme